jgi:hypothetical protein
VQRTVEIQKLQALPDGVQNLDRGSRASDLLPAPVWPAGPQFADGTPTGVLAAYRS